MSGEEEVVEVLPGIWRSSASVISGPYTLSTNAYLVVDGDDGLLVDTAWWGDVGQDHLTALFAASGFAPERVRAIFLTHAHRDHSGYVNYLEQVTGARPIVHLAERETIASLDSYQGLPGEDAAVSWYRQFGVPEPKAREIVRTKLPDNPFDAERVHWAEDGESITIGQRRFEILHTPGHTPGHACLIERESGVLFSGDALLPRGHGNPHVTVRAFTPPDPLTDYADGIERLRDSAQLRVCLPGHGPVVEDVDGIVSSHLSLVQSKLDAALSAVGEDAASAYEIIARMPWRIPFAELTADPLFLSFADGLARLRRLATLGRIQRCDADVETYRLIAR